MRSQWREVQAQGTAGVEQRQHGHPRLAGRGRGTPACPLPDTRAQRTAALGRRACPWGLCWVQGALRCQSGGRTKGRVWGVTGAEGRGAGHGWSSGTGSPWQEGRSAGDADSAIQLHGLDFIYDT